MNRNVKLLYCIILVSYLCACTSVEEKAIPITAATASYPLENTSIDALRGRVLQSETGFIKFASDEEELWLSGFVSSSDSGGNFYKELYLQDSPTEPKVAVRLLLDQTALHTTYPIGRKVLVKLNGLGAGFHNGILSLGSYQADGVANLESPLIPLHLMRTEIQEQLIALPVSLDTLNEGKVGLWIALEGVQFAKSELGKTFAGEAFDAYDGERRVTDCASQQSILLSTSSYSKFKSIVLDEGSGRIQGILTRDYYNEKYILKVNYPEDLSLEALRCDPFFEESFETVPLGRFEGEGWQNFIEQGTQYWEVYEDENALGQSLRIGSYRSGDSKTICWLVSPALEVRSLENPVLAFRTSTAYADSSVLEIFLSENYEGSLPTSETATWVALDVRIANDDDNDVLWIDSGSVMLDTIRSPFHVAFRYTGSGKTAQDGTFELDDIRIMEGNQ